MRRFLNTLTLPDLFASYAKSGSQLCKFIAGGILVLTASQGVNASPIHITSFDVITATVLDGGIAQDAESINSPTIPNSQTLVAAANGSTNTTEVEWSADVNNMLLTLDFTHAIAAGQNGLCCDYARTAIYPIFFTALVNSTYEFVGSYSAINPVGTEVSSTMFFYDLSGGGMKFLDNTVSYNTVNEHFILGDSGDGDTFNEEAGAKTGLLFAGHQYLFSWGTSIMATSDNNLSPTAVTASAEGSFKFSIRAVSPVSSVPEPGSIFLLGLATAAVFATRKRAVNTL